MKLFSKTLFLSMALYSSAELTCENTAGAYQSVGCCDSSIRFYQIFD